MRKLKVGVFSNVILHSNRPDLGHNITYRTWPVLITSAVTKPRRVQEI